MVDVFSDSAPPIIDPALENLTVDQLAQLINEISPETFYQQAQDFDHAAWRLQEVLDAFRHESRLVQEAWTGQISESFENLTQGVSSTITTVLQLMQNPGYGTRLRQAGDALATSQQRLKDLQAQQTQQATTIPAPGAPPPEAVAQGNQQLALQIMHDLCTAYRDIGIGITPLPETGNPPGKEVVDGPLGDDGTSGGSTSVERNTPPPTGDVPIGLPPAVLTGARPVRTLTGGADVVFAGTGPGPASYHGDLTIGRGYPAGIGTFDMAPATPPTFGERRHAVPAVVGQGPDFAVMAKDVEDELIRGAGERAESPLVLGRHAVKNTPPSGRFGVDVPKDVEDELIEAAGQQAQALSAGGRPEVTGAPRERPGPAGRLKKATKPEHEDHAGDGSSKHGRQKPISVASEPARVPQTVASDPVNSATPVEPVKPVVPVLPAADAVSSAQHSGAVVSGAHHAPVSDATASAAAVAQHSGAVVSGAHHAPVSDPAASAVAAQPAPPPAHVISAERGMHVPSLDGGAAGESGAPQAVYPVHPLSDKSSSASPGAYPMTSGTPSSAVAPTAPNHSAPMGCSPMMGGMGGQQERSERNPAIVPGPDREVWDYANGAPAALGKPELARVEPQQLETPEEIVARMLERRR